jgi:hypothetical protein
MQQLTSSLTTEAQSINQETEYFKKWTTDKIEFFDSNVDEDDSIINVDRHVFYKDIYVFVDKFKNMITIRENDKLRTILSQCFRDASLIWHFIELFDMKKNLLRQINLAFWYQVMINRFKKRTSSELSTLQNFKYILTNARFEKDFKQFAQQIFRSIKTINMNSNHNQLTIAWNKLDWRFRTNIFESIITTFIRKFLNQLNSMSNIWQKMIRSQSQNQFKLFRNRFQNSRRIQNYFEYLLRSNSLFSYQYQSVYSNNQFFYQFNARSQKRFEYQNRNDRSFYSSQNNRYLVSDSRYFKKKSSKFASVLSSSKQFLQIIDENANQNASDFSYFEIKSRNYKKKDRAYVIEKNENENQMKNSNSDDDIEYYHESNSNLNYYDSNLDQNQNEVEVNVFTSIQILKCKKCRTIFFFNNQLHKHLR